MDQEESLYNNGIVAINISKVSAREKTVVVLGAPRGGTSMVAGSLHYLGVQMGDKLTEATYEYPAMINAIADHNLSKVREIVNERNLKYPTWGWKQPAHIDYFFDEVLPLLRNPILIAIYRDVLSIGNRNSISAGLDVSSNMLASLNLYHNMTRRIVKAEVPTLLVSYEKTIQRADKFVNEIATVLGITDSQVIIKTVSFIEPSPKKYLLKSYLLNTGTHGRMDSIRPKSVAGWAFTEKTDKAALVDLYVNDKLTMTTEANQFRKDLFEKGLHPNGCCGFIFQIHDDHHLKYGDSIRVRIKGQQIDLANCPLSFKNENQL